MLVVEVDTLHPEPTQTPIARLADVLGAPADAKKAAIVSTLDREFGGQHNLVAASFEGPADEAFVGPDPVHVGGVPQGDTEVERVMKQVDVRGIVARAVEIGHAHATQADGRNLQFVSTELPLLHTDLPKNRSLSGNSERRGEILDCYGETTASSSITV